MKDFLANAGRLRTLSVGAKLLYSAFALSAIIGLVVSWRLYGAMMADANPDAYYAGSAANADNPPPSSAPPAPDTAGPELDLPDEATHKPLIEPISQRKLLEVTHFHLFSIPVYVLILAHLWLLIKLPAWAHTSGVALAVVTSALHIAAPWLIRSYPALSWLMPISGIAMLVTLGIMALLATLDMWLPRQASDTKNRKLT